MGTSSDQPERPRSEPEILPPDRSRPPDWDRPAWRPNGPTWSGGTHRVFVSRLGPFGVAMLMLAFAGILGVLFLAVLGAALIWLPVIALGVVVGAIYRWLR